MVTRQMGRAIALSIIMVALQGCQEKPREPYVFMLSDFMNAKVLPYDTPAQVIYRIDDHRFLTLEHYRDCNHGETFYNDTRTGIHQQLGRGDFENFQGRLVNADPTGRNLAFPAAAPPHVATPDNGWAVELLYSTDGGKTFDSMDYMPHSFNPFEDSKDYTVAVTKDSLFISQSISKTADAVEVDRYPLFPGFVYETKEKLPEGKHIEFDTKMPDGLRTPSGQDRIICDPSIKPTNPDAPLAPQ
ncbi:T6SS immunity protein Tli3 family protein [Paraburkholderia kururiensis]|uniref:T6SS immunity protein Tli3 family protein n=1 Tax=Paraburkholderia kururiensis TaxID=984307 RepID=UPI000376D11D